MPKKFALVLIIIQGLLTFLHYLLYLTLLTFFPALYSHHLGLLAVILSVSVSFLVFSIASHFYYNWLLAAGYYLSGIGLIFFGYYMLFACVALVIFAFSNIDPKILGLTAVGITGLLTLYGLVNARVIRTINLKIKLPNLPEVWKSRTVIMLSDLHLGQVLNIGYAKKVVRKINSLKPDLVLVPGDFYDGVHTNFAELAHEFSPGNKVKAPLGVYFSSGNHEMFAGYQVCEQAIKQAGIKILENDKVEVDGLQLVGLSYQGDPVTFEGETNDNVKARLAKIGIDKNKPSILLKHVPNHLEAVESMGINFQVSGHSHQGQIWPGRHITKKVWKGYDYGFHTLGKLQVYISSGIGTWGPSLRVFTRSEIIKIKFI